MDWLPEFALKYSEYEEIEGHNARRQLLRAAKVVYDTEKYQKRGEFGELLLHVVVRECFDSLPAVSKIFYKSAENDTVKGFDCVHVVPGPDGLELWLGEAKFYGDLEDAIRKATDELLVHTKRDYLRDEFALITNKIDEAWEHADALKDLLHENTSLDNIFARACIPVLLTYDSDAVANHTEASDAYVSEFEKEVTAAFERFSSKLPNIPIRVHLFLIPLKSKLALVSALHAKLEAWQNL